MKPKLKIGLILSSIIVVIIAGWYFFSLYSLNKTTEQINLLVEEINAPLNHFKSSDSYLDTIDYVTLEQYNNIFESNKPEIQKLQESFSKNSGVSFWFSKQRDAAIKTVNSFLIINDSLFIHTSLVTENLSNLNIDFVDQVNSNNKSRENARNTFKKESDEVDFNKQKKLIKIQSKTTSNVLKEVSKFNKSNQLEGLASNLQVSVLNQYDIKLEIENNLLRDRLESLNEITKSLRSYKSELRRSVSTNAGVISNLKNVSNRMHPVVSTINIEVKSMREILEKMEEPVGGLLGSKISSSLSSFGLSSKTSDYAGYSTIDWIKEFDSTSGKILETMSTVVKELVKLENEINTIASTTQPFLTSVSTFPRDRSRSNMLSLIESALDLNKYIELKKDLFMPLVIELDKVKSGMFRIESIAYQARLPSSAKPYIRQLSGHANKILSTCYYPFDRWEQITINIAEPLGNIAIMEANYMDELDKLSQKKR